MINFKPHPRYKRYLVYEDGRVYSQISNKFLKEGKGLRYNHYGLAVEKGSVKSVPTHHLVAETFLGLKPKGMSINHKDGKTKNNHISNLEYCSSSYNQIHSQRILHNLNGRANIRFEDAFVIQVISNSTSWIDREIAEMFGMSRSAVSNLKNGHTWKWNIIRYLARSVE